MAITINHQTNDISATSGSLTIDGSAAGGGGSLSASTISGSSQTVDFSAADIFVSTANQDITYTFANPNSVDKIDLIIDYQVTGGFTLKYAEYTGNRIFVGGQEITPTGVFFKPDGTKMYIVGSINDSVFQYSLSTAWDVTSATYDSVSFSVSSQETSPTGLFFKPDGTKMYISGIQSDEINEYSLSTAWSISTASFTRVLSVTAKALGPEDLFFKSDGTKMYVLDDQADKVFQYSLSTAWDISTASYEKETAALSEGLARSLTFSSDGTKMFVLGLFLDLVSQYELSTAWDVSTATETGTVFSVQAQDTNMVGMAFKPDGKKLFLVGYGADSVFEYDSNDGPTLTFPSSLELPAIDKSPGKKFALTLITTDSGTSYQVVSQSGPIN